MVISTVFVKLTFFLKLTEISRGPYNKVNQGKKILLILIVFQNSAENSQHASKN